MLLPYAVTSQVTHAEAVDLIKSEVKDLGCAAQVSKLI